MAKIPVSIDARSRLDRALPVQGPRHLRRNGFAVGFSFFVSGAAIDEWPPTWPRPASARKARPSKHSTFCSSTKKIDCFLSLQIRCAVRAFDCRLGDALLAEGAFLAVGLGRGWLFLGCIYLADEHEYGQGDYEEVDDGIYE